MRTCSKLFPPAKLFWRVFLRHFSLFTFFSSRHSLVWSVCMDGWAFQQMDNSMCKQLLNGKYTSILNFILMGKKYCCWTPNKKEKFMNKLTENGLCFDFLERRRNIESYKVEINFPPLLVGLTCNVVTNKRNNICGNHSFIFHNFITFRV